jgi:ring-1,2-phenylacetyl-CoA epoxidase subunit PaaE
MINGNEERRSYSICNAPSEKSNTLEVLVKLLEGGKVSVISMSIFIWMKFLK